MIKKTPVPTVTKNIEAPILPSIYHIKEAKSGKSEKIHNPIPAISEKPKLR
jgi:hypothetical protein